MNYEESVKYIKSRTPSEKLGLDGVRALLDKLRNPENRLKFVHVTGTNGKGSVSNMIAAIVKASGLRAGIFNSPYIESFREYFRVDDEYIEEDEFAELCTYVKGIETENNIRVSEFEFCVAMMLEYFERKHCDIVVLEVGMGGEHDATNVIPAPLVSVLTNIGLDHTAFLGGTVSEIATEKAGIIKPSSEVVAYNRCGEAFDVIAARAEACGTVVHTPDFESIVCEESTLSGQCFSYGGFAELKLPLLGEYQLYNASVAIETVFALRRKGIDIPDCAVREGLSNVRWPFRFEIVKSDPYVILDGGHNPQGIDEVCKNIERYLKGKRIICVVAVMADKDYYYMFEKLSQYAEAFVCVRADNVRALAPEKLAEYIAEYGRKTYVCESPEDGMRKAMSLAESEDCVLAVGSFYMMKDIVKAL